MIAWTKEPLRKPVLFAVGIPLGIFGGLASKLLASMVALLVGGLLGRTPAAIAAGITVAGIYGLALWVARYAAGGSRRRQLRETLREVREGKRCAWSYGLFEQSDRRFPYGDVFICEEAPLSLRDEPAMRN